MKATGIVRRIDDLGRVVVPKEIRRTLRIREGDPLEIYTSADGSIILKKYSPIVELGEFAEEFAKSLELVLGGTVVVCDKDIVIAASGESKKQFVKQNISSKLEKIIEKRNTQLLDVEIVPVYENQDVSAVQSQLIRPIISDGNTIGAIALLSNKQGAFGEAAQRSVEVAALFIGMQMQ